ncbi:MAG: sulfatase [Myxococcota bacterium]
MIPWSSRQRALAAVWAAVGLVLPMAAAVAADRAESDEPPNVLLIVLCSFRRDHMGVSGYPRPTTPFLDSMAASGTFFENAASASSWTLPSSTSLLTGLTPNVHGLTDFYTVHEIKTRKVEPKRVLGDSVETLAELFRRAGYATGARVNNFHVSDFFNLMQGFDDAVTAGFKTDELVGEFERWLQRIDAKKPFFFLLFSRDAHVGYKADYAYYLKMDRSGAPLSKEEYVGYFSRLRADMKKKRAAKVPFDDGLKRSWVDLYDAELAQLDAALSRLPAVLEASGRGGDTVIVVTADHGERFFERGRVGHGEELDEAVVEIPLIITGPGVAAGKRVAALARSIDVYPTIADLAGLETPVVVQGASLVPLLHGEKATLPERTAFSSYMGRDHVLRRGRFKIWRDEGRGGDRLYDLERDPNELHDVAASRPAVVRELSAELDRWLVEEAALQARILRGAARALGPEAVEALRALGYID